MECGFCEVAKIKSQNKMFTPMSCKSKIIPRVLCNNRRENKYTKKLVTLVSRFAAFEALERYYISFERSHKREERNRVYGVSVSANNKCRVDTRLR